MTALLAHAGHGSTAGDSLIHLLVEPTHLPFTLAALVVAVALVGWVVYKRRKA